MQAQVAALRGLLHLMHGHGWVRVLLDQQRRQQRSRAAAACARTKAHHHPSKLSPPNVQPRSASLLPPTESGRLIRHYGTICLTRLALARTGMYSWMPKSNPLIRSLCVRMRETPGEGGIPVKRLCSAGPAPPAQSSKREQNRKCWCSPGGRRGVRKPWRRASARRADTLPYTQGYVGIHFCRAALPVP